MCVHTNTHTRMHKYVYGVRSDQLAKDKGFQPTHHFCPPPHLEENQVKKFQTGSPSARDTLTLRTSGPVTDSRCQKCSSGTTWGKQAKAQERAICASGSTGVTQPWRK